MRSPQTERNEGTHSKMDGALLVVASLIAAVQLNKEEIRNTPSVRSAIGQTIQLARMIWTTIESVGR